MTKVVTTAEECLSVGQEKGTAEDRLAVFQWYTQRLLPTCTGIDISHADLMWHLSRDDRCGTLRIHPCSTERHFDSRQSAA